MNRLLFLSALLGIAASGPGCIRPNRLQYDYGRAYSESFAMQVDTSRASVKDNVPSISGVEGLALRKAVVEETTTAKTGQAQAIE
jgi:hypothetical protein